MFPSRFGLCLLVDRTWVRVRYSNNSPGL